MEKNLNDVRRSVIKDYNALIENATNVDRMPETAYDEIRAALQTLRESIFVLASISDPAAGMVSLANEKILSAP
jgi:hypothetical protein